MKSYLKHFLPLVYVILIIDEKYTCYESVEENTSPIYSESLRENIVMYTSSDHPTSVSSYTLQLRNEDASSHTEDIEERSSTTFDITTIENTTDEWNATDNPTDCPANLILPVKGTDEEVNHSLKILLMLFVIALCFMQIFFLMRSKFHYIPESSVVVFTGALFGAFFDVFSGHLPGDFKKKEAFDPTIFFLFLLPPIMYESGYNLHKGNFFRNFASILIFAVIGTAVSAFVIGGSIFLLGQQGVLLELKFAEAFAYGSFLSAVDPVATLAVFQALDVDPVLNMLVIGESILNDAVAIVLAGTVFEQQGTDEEDSIPLLLLRCVLRFTTVFLSSAAVGLVSGFLAALLFKHVELRKYPWMELGMMFIFIYAPYCVANVLQLSAIMTILFNGIVMSHYTHLNLSRVVQNIMQVTLRSVAFMAETCVFAYLGVSIFSYHMMLDLPFVMSSIVLCLVARAINIFPLSFMVNMFRELEITPKMMFIMWFSAVRGAVSFALALRFEFEEKKRNVIITATLVIVLFTTIVFGGGTMPMLKLLQKEEKKGMAHQQPCPSNICLIKTEKMGETIDADELSDLGEVDLLGARNFFTQMDKKYLVPFFTRNTRLFYDSDMESKTSDDIFRR